MPACPAPVFAIVVGELSGDTLGAGLIRALRQHYPDARFIGIAGPQMLAEGAETLCPMERLSVMGLTEVVPRLPELFRLRRQLEQWFVAEGARLYIGIDSPDFTLSLARRLHRRGLRTLHYVSPSVWAWRQGRIQGIRRDVDHMLTLLPFEAAFYQQHQVPVTFVGHPLADIIPLQPPTAEARAELGLDSSRPVLAVLPGSRSGEVRQLLPDFLAAARQVRARRPGLQIVIPAATPEREQEILAELARQRMEGVQCVAGKGRTVMAAADVVLMASGTATLEGLLLKKPMVIGYRLGALTYRIARRLVKIDHVGLPNLLTEQPLIPELIQDQLTPEAAAKAVLEWLDNPDRVAALTDAFDAVHQRLRRDASATAADAVVSVLAAEPRG